MKCRLAIAVSLLLASLAASNVHAAITFIPGSNVTPERLAGLQAAADELEALIDFQQDIKVSVSFSALSCSQFGAVLGYAGPYTAYANFAGTPQNNTWYVSAQAANAGVNYAMDDAVHISAEFNHNLGNTGCLDGVTWYYGADHNPAGNQIDFVSTAVHEFMHGLGFLSLISSDGNLNGGLIDNYSSFLYDNGTGKSWKDMTAGERATSILNNHNLIWDGAKTTAMVSLLQAGTTAGKAQLYAPSSYEQGSSTSHFDVSVLYDNGDNEVMEPMADFPEDSALAVAAFCDMGWPILQDTDGDTINDCDDSDPLVAAVIDTDGDGVPDSSDAFPSDPLEWLDTDSDSAGNNADYDDDNDGVPDVVDSQPLNPAVATEIVLPRDGAYKGAGLNEYNRP